MVVYGAWCAMGFDGSERTAGAAPAVFAAVKDRALPGSLPTNASPKPMHTSPNTSLVSPVSGFAVCSTNAFSAGTTSMSNVAMCSESSSTPQALRDRNARSFHLDAHTFLTAW